MSPQMRKAQKEWSCAGCDETISPKEYYYGFSNDERDYLRFCVECTFGKQE